MNVVQYVAEVLRLLQGKRREGEVQACERSKNESEVDVVLARQPIETCHWIL